MLCDILALPRRTVPQKPCDPGTATTAATPRRFRFDPPSPSTPCTSPSYSLPASPDAAGSSVTHHFGRFDQHGSLAGADPSVAPPASAGRGVSPHGEIRHPSRDRSPLSLPDARGGGVREGRVRAASPQSHRTPPPVEFARESGTPCFQVDLACLADLPSCHFADPVVSTLPSGASAEWLGLTAAPPAANPQTLHRGRRQGPAGTTQPHCPAAPHTPPDPGLGYRRHALPHSRSRGARQGCPSAPVSTSVSPARRGAGLAGGSVTPTPYPSPALPPSVTQGEMEIADFEAADACGIGAYEHCGGFEEFDSELGGDELAGGAAAADRGPVFLRLYAHAVARDCRMRQRQIDAEKERAESDRAIMSRGQNARVRTISPVNLQRSVRQLSSTKRKERNIERLKEQIRKEEMVECTFAPKTLALDRPCVIRSGSPGFADRLYSEAARRKEKRTTSRKRLIQSERLRVEDEKRKANPAYADRVKQREDRQRLVEQRRKIMAVQ